MPNLVDQANVWVQAVHHARELVGGNDDVTVTLPHDSILCLTIGGQQVVDLGISGPALLSLLLLLYELFKQILSDTNNEKEQVCSQ